MKIIVLGAGVIGVSSAYYLASQGHEVVVIDKNKSCGLDCSYANGGQLSYSHITTWASEISFQNFLHTFFSKNSYSSFNRFNLETISWLYKFYKNSNNSIARQNSQKLYKIASYSRYLITKLLDIEDFDFAYTTKGILHIYRNKSTMDKAINNLRKLDISGIRPLIYSADQCVEHEPNLIKALDEKKIGRRNFI